MAELLYRINKVIKEYHSLELIPGKWGKGEAALGDVVELHRPDGIVILVPIHTYSGNSRAIILRDLISLDLVPVGTEVRIPGKKGPEARSVIRPGAHDKIDRPQFLRYSFTPSFRGPNPYQKLSAGPVVVWFPMHPLLARVRSEVERQIQFEREKQPEHRTAKSARKIELRAARLRWLEKAADGGRETVVWRRGRVDGSADIVASVAQEQIKRREFARLLCPDCAAEDRLEDLEAHDWTAGACGGSLLLCPKEHPLFEREFWRGMPDLT